MRTPNLEPKTLDQILEVIRITQSNYTSGLPIDHSYQDAIRLRNAYYFKDLVESFWL